MSLLASTMLTEPARSVPLYGSFDVVVLGGGPAGIAAAASAARNGASVLLAERYGFLGGMGTAAGVTNFCGLHANVFGAMKQVVHGVAGDLLERMRALDGLNEPHLVLRKTLAQAYDMSAFKCAADDVLVSSGVKVLFHALAAGVMKSSSACWMRCCWKPSPAGWRSGQRSSSTARAMPISRSGPGCRRR